MVESSTADVAYAKQPDRRRAVASATKLMTALLTLERSRPSTEYRAVRYRALPAESKINLQPGEQMTVADLLRGLLIESANDAAATLAARVGGSEAAFVRSMNRARAEARAQETRTTRTRSGSTTPPTTRPRATSCGSRCGCGRSTSSAAPSRASG